ncbi:hypothetical protein RQP53_16150 [Paucibacter sp. APW11]|uniref:Lipoprotein n=1 Tax=Roseateles aquae TaxID=3077235 RepID=A0ABU3PDX5_9BURK|nr:hypothetical protein [Paucibacter sp. APW11]MDT9000810.1 hypothetical protein [Paucibacter sp. APW11]
MNKRQIRALASLIAAGGLLGGCATVSDGVEQSIQLSAQQEGGQAVAGVSCVLSNKLGQWRVQAPGEVRVKRSDGQLFVSCESSDWVMATSTPVAQESDSKVGNSAVKGAGIGAGIGVLLGVLAPITLPFVGPMVGVSVVAGGTVGAAYGGIAGAVVDGASGAAYDYAPRIVVLMKPRPPANEKLADQSTPAG